MNMHPALRLVLYLIVNGIFAFSIYVGMLSGYTGEYATGFENLALFIGWMAGLMGTLILLALSIEKSAGKADLIESLARATPSLVPFVIDCTFDILVVAAFVFSGHFVLAIFYGISIVAGKEMRDASKNLVLRNLTSQKL